MNGCPRSSDRPGLLESAQVERQLVIRRKLHVLDLVRREPEDRGDALDVAWAQAHAESTRPSATFVSQAEVAAQPGQGGAVLRCPPCEVRRPTLVGQWLEREREPGHAATHNKWRSREVGILVMADLFAMPVVDIVVKQFSGSSRAVPPELLSATFALQLNEMGQEELRCRTPASRR